MPNRRSRIVTPQLRWLSFNQRTIQRVGNQRFCDTGSEHLLPCTQSRRFHYHSGLLWEDHTDKPAECLVYKCLLKGLLGMKWCLTSSQGSETWAQRRKSHVYHSGIMHERSTSPTRKMIPCIWARQEALPKERVSSGNNNSRTAVDLVPLSATTWRVKPCYADTQDSR